MRTYVVTAGSQPAPEWLEDDDGQWFCCWSIGPSLGDGNGAAARIPMKGGPDDAGWTLQERIC